MINEITSGFERYQPQMKAAPSQTGVFAQLLAENLQQDNAAPQKMTAEQKAWLRSKYDLSALRVSTEEMFINEDGRVQGYRHYTPEYKEFLGDLVSLNVLTPQEAGSLTAVTVPAHTGVFRREEPAAADRDGETADLFIEAVKRSVEKQREMIEYIEEKSRIPSAAQPEDFDYLQSAKELLARKQELFDKLMWLFG